MTAPRPGVVHPCERCGHLACLDGRGCDVCASCIAAKVAATHPPPPAATRLAARAADTLAFALVGLAIGIGWVGEQRELRRARRQAHRPGRHKERFHLEVQS